MEARHKLHAEILKLETRLKPGEKWNANQLALRIGVALGTAQNLLNGLTQRLEVGTAIKIADAFGEPREKWLELSDHNPLAEGIRFVSRMLAEGVPLSVVMAWVGHKSFSTTERYRKDPEQPTLEGNNILDAP